VNVKWNKVEPPAPGNHSVQVTSVVTGDAVHIGNNPTSFAFDDAHSRTGMIRILVPFSIPDGQVAPMLRYRHIPLLFRLVMNPTSCDNRASNNRKELRMRILGAPQQVDFVADIVESSLDVETKPNLSIVHDKMIFKATVRVKNLNIPSPAVQNVRCRYVIKWWNPRWGKYELEAENNDLVFETVGGKWAYKTVNEEFLIYENLWADLHFVVNIDHERKFNDINRRNNEDTLTFKKPAK
jgi:hypothetical protein